MKARRLRSPAPYGATAHPLAPSQVNGRRPAPAPAFRPVGPPPSDSARWRAQAGAARPGLAVASRPWLRPPPHPRRLGAGGTLTRGQSVGKSPGPRLRTAPRLCSLSLFGFLPILLLLAPGRFPRKHVGRLFRAAAPLPPRAGRRPRRRFQPRTISASRGAAAWSAGLRRCSRRWGP